MKERGAGLSHILDAEYCDWSGGPARAWALDQTGERLEEWGGKLSNKLDAGGQIRGEYLHPQHRRRAKELEKFV